MVIGSGFSFSVVWLALGLKDNGAGELSFVDPSYSRWSDPATVQPHFARFGNELKRYPRFIEPVDLRFAAGVALARVLREDAWKILGSPPTP